MKHTIFSVTYIAIVAAAGLVLGVPTAWQFATATAALAFFGAELQFLYSVTAQENIGRAATCVVLASWITGAIAGLSLLL